MKPYYEDGSVTIYNGDCRDVLPTLQPVHIVLTDPPYNVGYHYDSYSDNMPDDEYFKWLVESIGERCVFIHYTEAVFKYAFALGVTPSKVVAWVYHANTPKQWRSVAWFGCEPDLSLDGQPYRNPSDKRIQKRIAEGHSARLYDWWEIEQVKNVSHEKTEHPCQIPETLMKKILVVTPDAQVILDPFMGSGTTLRAAKDLGRKAVGIDIDERYCEIAAKRMSQVAMDLVIQ